MSDDAGIYTPDQCCPGYCVEVGGVEVAHDLPTWGRAQAVLLAEQGRRLASQREDLIAQGVDPADLDVPLHPSAGLK